MRGRISFTTASGRDVTLQIYVEPGKEGSLRLGDGIAQEIKCAGTRNGSAGNMISTSS